MASSAPSVNPEYEALKESEERFRVLFNSSRDAIMTLEPPSWRFASGNPATLIMFRAKSVEDFIARGPGEFSPELQPDGRPSAGKAREMIDTAMREGSHFFEWTHKRIDGEEFPATVLLTRMELAGKTSLQATVRDITEQKKAEKSLREAKERAEAALAEVKTLRGTLCICMHCHRIRTDARAWEKLEKYIEAHSDAEFSHGLCPECLGKHYGSPLDAAGPAESSQSPGLDRNPPRASEAVS